MIPFKGRIFLDNIFQGNHTQLVLSIGQLWMNVDIYMDLRFMLEKKRDNNQKKENLNHY